MANYKQILHYLKMFGRLYDVTKSIKLVAFTKFKKIQYRVKMYNDSLISIKKFSLFGDLHENFLNYLIIPLTSDKGCCGSINTQLMAYLEDYCNTLLSNNNMFNIILIGKKGLQFIKQKYRQNYLRYLQDVFSSSLSIISTVIMVEDINAFSFDICILLFNHFININEQKIFLFDVLSENKMLSSIMKAINKLDLSNLFLSVIYLKYANNKYLFGDLYTFIISLILLHSLLDHEISELGGRITSMEKSSQNALEMYNSLQIQYNKARQSYITNQLVEICSAIIAINSMRQSIVID